jgi:hypothetical protein
LQGTTWTPADYSHSAGGIGAFAPTDLDGDGDADVIAAAPSAGQVTFFYDVSLQSSFTGPHSIDSAFPGASSVDIADIDGDGVRDIVAAGTSGSSEMVR